MKVLSTTIADSMQMLGQSFLIAFYLPALLFFVVHLYVLLPAWQPTSNQTTEEPSSAITELCTAWVPFISPDPVDQLVIAFTALICENKDDQSNNSQDESATAWIEGLGDEVTSLLGAFFVGLILLRLNGYLIQGFEGKYRVLKDGILYFLTKRNRQQSKDLYGKLIDAQDSYQNTSYELWQSDSDTEKVANQQALAILSAKIDQFHNEIEQKTPVQMLPYEETRICPTRFGNHYAVAEEYSYQRYGADAVLFWTRLSELMQDEAPEHTQRLIQQKTTLDFTLNLTFLSVILVIEAILTLFGLYFYDQSANWWTHLPLFALVGIGIPLAILLYYSSVGAVYVLGELIKNSFDRYRHLILTSFGLKIPDTLSEEQVIWVRLAAFIRRGDEFYFPTEFKESTKD